MEIQLPVSVLYEAMRVGGGAAKIAKEDQSFYFPESLVRISADKDGILVESSFEGVGIQHRVPLTKDIEIRKGGVVCVNADYFLKVLGIHKRGNDTIALTKTAKEIPVERNIARGESLRSVVSDYDVDVVIGSRNGASYSTAFSGFPAAHYQGKAVTFLADPKPIISIRAKCLRTFMGQVSRLLSSEEKKAYAIHLRHDHGIMYLFMPNTGQTVVYAREMLPHQASASKAEAQLSFPYIAFGKGVSVFDGRANVEIAIGTQGNQSTLISGTTKCVIPLRDHDNCPDIAGLCALPEDGSLQVNCEQVFKHVRFLAKINPRHMTMRVDVDAVTLWGESEKFSRATVRMPCRTDFTAGRGQIEIGLSARQFYKALTMFRGKEIGIHFRPERIRISALDEPTVNFFFAAHPLSNPTSARPDPVRQ